MVVNTINLSSEIHKMNSLINEYENIFLNLYNEINNSSFFWNDNHSIAFYNNTNLEKLKVRQTITELKYVEDIYSYVYQNYSEFGRVIKFDLENFEKVYENFNLCNEQIKNVIRGHNGLDTSVCSEISGLINNNYTLLASMQEDLQLLKTSTKNALVKIENTEKEVRNKINHMDIEYIKESDIREFI